MFNKKTLKLVLISVMVIGVLLHLSAFTAEEDLQTWFKEAAEPFKDVTINGIGETTTPSMIIANQLAPEFEKITGINVNFETTSWGEMYAKEIGSMLQEAGTYDVIYVEQDIAYSFISKGWLTDLTNFMEEHPNLNYPNYDIGDFTTFIDYFKDSEGHILGFPFESFLKVYTYRKDLFNDPEVKSAFKEEYGWELKPARNWEEYKQIAEFFYEWGKDRKPRLYGHSAQIKGVTLPYTFVETYWPCHGVWNWGINMNKMRASVENGGNLNGPKGKEALQDFLDLLKYAPPEVDTYTWEGAAAALATEKSPQGMVYGDQLAWVATDPEKSDVIGKIGVTIPPTAPGVLEAAKAGEGYVGYFDGGALSVPADSKKKAAAWLFIQYVTSKTGAEQLAMKGFAPVRTSTLNKLVGSKLDKKSGGYFTLMKEKGHLFSGAPPFPFHKLVLEGPLFKWLHEAVANRPDVNVDEIMDKMTDEVDVLLERYGY